MDLLEKPKARFKNLKPKWRWALGVGLIVFILAGLLLAKIYRSVLSEPINSWKEDLRADCAVVLTGGAGRVKEGFALLSQKRIKKLIISGVNPNVQIRELLPVWPVSGDLSESDIILDRRSSTTYGNSQQTLALVEALRCQDVLLVTSNLHMGRAYRTFVSAFPPHIALIKYSVVAGRGEADFWEISTEVAKRIFYSLWAY